MASKQLIQHLLGAKNFINSEQALKQALEQALALRRSERGRRPSFFSTLLSSHLFLSLTQYSRVQKNTSSLSKTKNNIWGMGLELGFKLSVNQSGIRNQDSGIKTQDLLDSGVRRRVRREESCPLPSLTRQYKGCVRHGTHN